MENVEAGYYANDLVLDDVTIHAQPQKVTVILGPNGSGKSTTLRVMSGVLPPRTGRVYLGDRDITRVATHQRLREGIALLPQGRSTFPDMSVHENLQVGAWTLFRDKARFTEALDRTYERYPALKEFRHKSAGSLSGGQQRIVEIARMMIADPQVLLIDEPSVGLAPILVGEVYKEITRFKDENRTIVLVDQNVQAAVELADYVYTLAYGRNHLEGDHRDFEGKLSQVVRDWLQF